KGHPLKKWRQVRANQKNRMLADAEKSLLVSFPLCFPCPESITMPESARKAQSPKQKGSLSVRRAEKLGNPSWMKSGAAACLPTVLLRSLYKLPDYARKPHWLGLATFD